MTLPRMSHGLIRTTDRREHYPSPIEIYPYGSVTQRLPVRGALSF
jgi:hypothetical protein